METPLPAPLGAVKVISLLRHERDLAELIAISPIKLQHAEPTA